MGMASRKTALPRRRSLRENRRRRGEGGAAGGEVDTTCPRRQCAKVEKPSPLARLFAASGWNRRLSSFRLEAGAHLVLRRCIEVHCLAPLIADADIPPRTSGGAPIRIMIFQLDNRLIVTGHLFFKDAIREQRVAIIRRFGMVEQA